MNMRRKVKTFDKHTYECQINYHMYTLTKQAIFNHCIIYIYQYTIVHKFMTQNIAIQVSVYDCHMLFRQRRSVLVKFARTFNLCLQND